jgi:hypothetical protein
LARAFWKRRNFVEFVLDEKNFSDLVYLRQKMAHKEDTVYGHQEKGIENILERYKRELNIEKQTRYTCIHKISGPILKFLEKCDAYGPREGEEKADEKMQRLEWEQRQLENEHQAINGLVQRGTYKSIDELARKIEENGLMCRKAVLAYRKNLGIFLPGDEKVGF